jgi:hypothetical protein
MIDFIKRLFKKPLPNTAIHPKYKTLIEKVAKIKGRQLYQFKNLLDMPSNRYSQCSRFTTEFTMRLDADILKTSIKDCLEYANEGNFTKVIGILTLLQEHTNMLLSLSASYRLASCVYFWDDENLDNYDFEIGDEKIRLFKEIGFESFFLTKPMNNFVPQMNISAQDLEAYSQYEKELKKLLGNQLKPQTAKKEKVI